MLQVKSKPKFSHPKVCKLLVLGALALLGAGCEDESISNRNNGQAVAAAVPSAVPVFKVEKPETEKGRRFEMNLTLDQPEDLKVNQGDKVVAGQVVADRKPSEQQRLTRIQLVSQINAIAHPPEEFHLLQANQEVQLAQAQLKSYVDSSPYTAAAPVPLSRLVKEQELEAQLAAAANKRNAITAQLEVARQEIRLKKEQLNLQLKAIDAEAEQLKVKSPYTGTIRRVKVERGSNRGLSVVLTIQSKEVAR
jgi:multidrug efflux pump subunit AcrA (membrane-fusion protein)